MKALCVDKSNIKAPEVAHQKYKRCDVGPKSQEIDQQCRLGMNNCQCDGVRILDISNINLLSSALKLF